MRAVVPFPAACPSVVHFSAPPSLALCLGKCVRPCIQSSSGLCNPTDTPGGRRRFERRKAASAPSSFVVSRRLAVLLSSVPFCGIPFQRIEIVRAVSDVTSSSGRVVMASAVIPGVVVGAGRVGSALEKMGGGRDVVVRRGETIPGDSTGPILVCTRNDALDSVVDQTPEARREDLVFFQNGMLDPWLASRGLQDATQILVYFAVAKLGDTPIDGVTDLNPEGLTAASGKWAEAVAARLHSAGLSCKVLSRAEFERPMLEKLIWISAFMLVGVRNRNASIGDVESKYRGEVEQLILELANAATEHQRQLPGRGDFAFDEGLVERLCAYARSVAHYPTAIKELQWRNGWFLHLADEAVARGSADPCPLHRAWLKEVGAIA